MLRKNATQGGPASRRPWLNPQQSLHVVGEDAAPPSFKGRQQLAGLLASAEPFCEQHECLLEIRSTSRIHDRFLVVDNRSVFQSGSSFKDGARKAATNLIEVIDIAAAVRHVYEELWKSAKAEFSAHERSSSCTTHAPHTT